MVPCCVGHYVNALRIYMHVARYADILPASVKAYSLRLCIFNRTSLHPSLSPSTYSYPLTQVVPTVTIINAYNPFRVFVGAVTSSPDIPPGSMSRVETNVAENQRYRVVGLLLPWRTLGSNTMPKVATRALDLPRLYGSLHVHASPIHSPRQARVVAHGRTGAATPPIHHTQWRRPLP